MGQHVPISYGHMDLIDSATKSELVAFAKEVIKKNTYSSHAEHLERIVERMIELELEIEDK